jgi:hypothetical protein
VSTPAVGAGLHTFGKRDPQAGSNKSISCRTMPVLVVNSTLMLPPIAAETY